MSQALPLNEQYFYMILFFLRVSRLETYAMTSEIYKTKELKSYWRSLADNLTVKNINKTTIKNTTFTHSLIPSSSTKTINELQETQSSRKLLCKTLMPILWCLIPSIIMLATWSTPRRDSSPCIEIQIVLNMGGDNAKSTEAIATVYQWERSIPVRGFQICTRVWNFVHKINMCYVLWSLEI